MYENDALESTRSRFSFGISNFKRSCAKKSCVEMAPGFILTSKPCATRDASGRSASVKSPVRERGSGTWRTCLLPIEQALMLDVDYGSYPVSLRQLDLVACASTHDQQQFVTSSSTTLAGIIGGLTLNPKNITETVGVVKACTSIAPRPVSLLTGHRYHPCWVRGLQDRRYWRVRLR